VSKGAHPATPSSPTQMICFTEQGNVSGYNIPIGAYIAGSLAAGFIVAKGITIDNNPIANLIKNAAVIGAMALEPALVALGNAGLAWGSGATILCTQTSAFTASSLTMTLYMNTLPSSSADSCKNHFIKNVQNDVSLIKYSSLNPNAQTSDANNDANKVLWQQGGVIGNLVAAAQARLVGFMAPTKSGKHCHVGLQLGTSPGTIENDLGVGGWMNGPASQPQDSYCMGVDANGNVGVGSPLITWSNFNN